VTRGRVAARLGTAGALLLGAAGLVQTTLGAVIPDWTGDKLAPVGLGLLTVGLAAVALVTARRFLRPGLSPGQRAAGALGLAGPGLLCLTTVGVLAWVPAVLLVGAGALAVADGPREAARAVVAHWPQVLLSVLGGYELLMAAAAPPWLMAVGAVSGTALVLAAWLPARTGVLVALVLLGTAPLAVAGWFAVVPVLVAVVALPIAATVLRSRPSTEPVPNTGKDV
jgi:hypothetical protein